MTELPPQANDAASVADALSRALAPVDEDLVSWTARTARAVFGAEAVSIALLTDDGGELVFTTSSGGWPDITGQRLPAAEGIAGFVATTGQPLAVSDLERDPRFAATFADQTGYRPKAILAAPIEVDDRILGVIEVLDRDSSRAGSDEDLSLLTLFGRQAAVALEAAARSRRIGDLVLHALTSGEDLATALHSAPGSRPPGSGDVGVGLPGRYAGDDGLGEVAAAFARLAAVGPTERALATAVLNAVAGYAHDRS